MKRLLASFIILSILLSACSTVQPSNTDGDNSTESYSTESQHGTTDSTHTEQPTNTQSGGETVNTETTQGTESTTGATDLNTGETQGNESTQPTQGNTQPTEGNTTTPTEGSKPNVTEPPATEETTPPATDPIPPTNPTDPTTPTNPTNPITPMVVNLTVSPTSLNLVVGNTSTLTASYNGTGTLSWSSSNTSVVTVSNGKVTAKAAGNAVVTVSDGSKSATCSITVTGPATEKSFIFLTRTATITVGNTRQIEYYYSGNNSDLTWASTDPSVLIVDSNGLVTAKAKGIATVEVTDGENTWRGYDITVEDIKPAVTSLDWTNQNAPLYDGITKYAGDYMSFKLYARPYGCNPKITVTSSNTSVVSASYKLNSSDATEVTLNFVGAGTATVKIDSADGAYSESYTITVKSDYDCNPGDGLLTPEQFAYCVNKVVEAHGFTISSNASSYKYLYLTDAELTWAYARREGENSARHWWSIGSRYVNVTYVGIAENGKHLFYTYH